MPKKLAVTIAGAVSLGSYEAGVVWEVLDAIRQHNEKQTDVDDKIIIDVITGASAGGMTAVILGQKLLYCADEFNGADDNPLYNTWVKGISLQQLQNTQTNEDALLSIFSSNLIDDISQNTVMARYNDPEKKPAQRHAAVGDRLSIGLALTNLNGLPYSYDMQTGGKFTYIDFSDELTRNIHDAAAFDNRESWEPLRQAAVACGAFPIAFRTQDIKRLRKVENSYDYDSETLQWPDTDPVTFTYSDGGVLQNQPLGMAKNFVDMIDDHHRQDQRFYLFVSPHAHDPKPTIFTSAEANYLQVIKRLVGVFVGQAGFRDWITAEGVNTRVRLLDRRACQLQKQIINGNITVDALATVSDEIIKLFFNDPQRKPQPGASTLEPLADAQGRIARQYHTEIAGLATQKAQDAFRDAVLAFETAAGLGARDIMRIYAVTAEENALAGAGLQSFLGFFNLQYRQHDYNVGRINGRKAITEKLGKADQLGIALPDWKNDAIDPMKDYDGPQLHKLCDADRTLFETGLKKRLNAALKDTPHIFGESFVADRIVDAFIDHLTKPLNPEPPLGPPS